MATSTCPKCSSTSFELKEASSLKGSQFRLNFIQCASCGTVVGVVEYHNTASLLEKLSAKLGFKLFG